MSQPTIPTIAWCVLLGAAIAVGTLSHVSRETVDARLHQAQHAAAITAGQLKCGPGVKQSHQKPDGTLICVYEVDRTYGRADRRVYVAAK